MLEIDRNCYKLIMSRGTYNFLRMYGYGQGMMTQAALLLDEMHDAEQMLHLMLTHAYLPKMEGFLAPEGIMTHTSGKFYLPVNGYLGQDAHIADSVKAVRLMLGVDDNRENLIRLVPRFPASWEHCGIEDYPVLTPDGRGKLSYRISRTETSYCMQIDLSAPSLLDVRIGPFDRRPCDTVRINGESVPLSPYRSGDSWWGMISRLNGSRFVIETEFS